MANTEQQRIALVSGGNKGIGFEIVRGLLQAGCVVYLGARDEGRGEQAARELASESGEVRVIALDLLRQDTLDAASARIQREADRLDILVNNAGIIAADDGTASTVPPSSVEHVLKTNVLGTLAVTQAFLPLI